MMKLSSSAIVASIVAASTAALSSSSSNSNSSSCVQDLRERKDGEISLGKEKFAPRFDGLRFIETLVTAHRLLQNRESLVDWLNQPRPVYGTPFCLESLLILPGPPGLLTSSM